jgi:RNA polymerase sigma-70 factor, ECF subfamily
LEFGIFQVGELETRTVTTSTLLRGLLASRDDRAWCEVDERYRPIVLRLAERCGLDADDAADVAQETLTQFFEDYRAGKYDRQRGRLRAWLTGIARHRIADARRRRGARGEERGDSGGAAAAGGAA